MTTSVSIAPQWSQRVPSLRPSACDSSLIAVAPAPTSSAYRPYMLRRYCPPTKALLICPSEQCRTASIITAKRWFVDRPERRQASACAWCCGRGNRPGAWAGPASPRPRSSAPVRSRWRRPIGLRKVFDDGAGAVVLLVLVVHRLFLDLAALVAVSMAPSTPP